MALSDKQIKIAVIGFVVIVIFLMALPQILENNLNSIKLKQKCLNDTDKVMNDFVSALQQTTNNKSPSNIIFNSPGCAKDEKFLIKKVDELRICSNSCLSSSSACVLLRYSSSEVSKIADKCVNIPFATQFNPAECSKLEGYGLIQIDSVEGFEKGNYNFIYYENNTTEYPAVCVYIKN